MDMSVWVIVEFAYDEPEVVMVVEELETATGWYPQAEWRRAGETWAATLPEGVGGMDPEATRVMLVKAPLVMS